MKNGQFEDEDGTQEWFLNGNRHREDGPAVIYPDGTQSWWVNNKLHREDGPAVIYPDGTKEWHVNGNYHREDGPVIIDADESQCWYVHGKHITLDVIQWFEEFNITYETMEFEDKMALKFFIRGLAT